MNRNRCDPFKWGENECPYLLYLENVSQLEVGSTMDALSIHNYTNEPQTYGEFH